MKLRAELEKRPYQEHAVQQVCEHWRSGARSVLLVAPPGSGKTEMGILAIQARGPGTRVLWVVHTRELALQAESRLRIHFGEPVSLIMEGRLELPGARITVAVVHSLLDRSLSGIDLMVLDEGHHYVADQWGLVLFVIKDEKPLVLGLTATPERDDGRGLDEAFDKLVVAAQYSELKAGGWIVPAKVYAPKTFLGRNWAENPLDAWFRFGKGQQTIGFFPSIHLAEHYADQLASRGVAALAFHSEQDKATRSLGFEAFESGACTMLFTVAAAIEGLNVPTASCALLARSFNFIGGYLQAPGRVLRASPGKKHGTIIDLTGCSIRHGAPDQDRGYSLSGRPKGGGIEQPERDDPDVSDPEVVGAEMVLAYSPPGDTDDLPPIPEIPEADPVRLRREIAIRKEVRKIHTRFGADAARSARKQLEALR